MTEDDNAGFVDTLTQFSYVVLNALTEIASEYELSVVQMRLLGILRDRQPNMNTLGRRLGLDKSSISGLVDRAQRRGLVTRTPSETDRRAFRVSITESGRELAEKIATEYYARIEHMMDALSAADRQVLAEIAERIVVSEARRSGLDWV